jgi:Cys-tRNA(Pro)/Cys-tRNA(Cys) deacylase
MVLPPGGIHHPGSRWRVAPPSATIPPVSGKGTRATDAARRAGVEHRVHEVDAAALDAAVAAGHRSVGEAVAAALELPAERVFKTLVAEVDGQLTVAVLPVAGSLDLKALAAVRGGRRAWLAESAAAERATGYVTGGISPLGQRRRLPTVVDRSALGFPTVFCSAGRRGLELELAPADLVELTDASVATLAR